MSLSLYSTKYLDLSSSVLEDFLKSSPSSKISSDKKSLDKFMYL